MSLSGLSHNNCQTTIKTVYVDTCSFHEYLNEPVFQNAEVSVCHYPYVYGVSDSPCVSMHYENQNLFQLITDAVWQLAKPNDELIPGESFDIYIDCVNDNDGDKVNSINGVFMAISLNSVMLSGFIDVSTNMDTHAVSEAYLHFQLIFGERGAAVEIIADTLCYLREMAINELALYSLDDIISDINDPDVLTEIAHAAEYSDGDELFMIGVC